MITSSLHHPSLFLSPLRPSPYPTPLTDPQEKELGVGLDDEIVLDNEMGLGDELGFDDEIFVIGGSNARVTDIERTPKSIERVERGHWEESTGKPSTTWLISPERSTPSPAKTYVPKPSRLKPPVEKMNYFAPPLAQAPPQSGEQEQPTEEIPGDDSPFTCRIKALERNPALAFAGSFKLLNDDHDVDNVDNAAGGRLGPAGTGHRDNPMPKKKTATELQVRVSFNNYYYSHLRSTPQARNSSPITHRPYSGNPGAQRPRFSSRSRRSRNCEVIPCRPRVTCHMETSSSSPSSPLPRRQDAQQRAPPRLPLFLPPTHAPVHRFDRFNRPQLSRTLPHRLETREPLQSRHPRILQERLIGPHELDRVLHQRGWHEREYLVGCARHEQRSNQSRSSVRLTRRVPLVPSPLLRSQRRRRRRGRRRRERPLPANRRPPGDFLHDA